MNKSSSFILILLLLFSFASSCNKASTKEPGVLKFRVSITPPVEIGYVNNIENYVQIMSAHYGINWWGRFEFADFSDYEFTINHRQIGYYDDFLDLRVRIENIKDFGCRRVKIEGLLDNKVFQTFELEAGYKTRLIMCGPDSLRVEQRVRFVMPTDR
jgi:hypothetical protein